MTDVRHEPDQHRYAGYVDGELAGFAEYRLREGIIDFTHTEVGDAYEGKGVGSAIARAALDDVRTTGERRVIATCPFIARWIAQHPDYETLLSTD